MGALVAVSVTAEEPSSPLLEPQSNVLPQVRRILAEGEFELLSLSPALLTEKQRRHLGKKLFHGYRVLGTAKIKKSEQRDQLLRALQEAIAGARRAYIYCFEPRHGIRATVGAETVDLLICFECERIEVYSPDKSLVFTSKTARPVLDAALKRAGIPLGNRP